MATGSAKVVLVMIGIFSFSSISLAQERNFDSDAIETGEDLRLACKADPVGCSNFILAVMGGLEIGLNHSGQKPPYCIPSNATRTDLWSALMRAFDEHKSLNSYRAASAVYLALTSSFRCKAASNR